MSSPSGYTEELKDDSSSSRLLSEDGFDDTQPLAPATTRSRSSTLLWALALIVSVVLTNIVSIAVTYRLATGTSKSVGEPPRGAAPLLRHLPLKPEPTRLTTPFYDAEDSIYRKHDSPVTEAAWLELTQLKAGVMLVAKEDAAASEIDPKKHVYWDNPEAGLVGHPVIVEATHQLHCLNLLRRYSYFNFNFTSEFEAEVLSHTTPKYQRLHVDHCVEYLRYRLMCTADAGIVPFFWLGREGRIAADMSRMHTCRNYDTIREFVKDNSIPRPSHGEVKPKPGDYVVMDYV